MRLPVLQRSAVAGAACAGVVGCAAGLVLGLLAYPPTASFPVTATGYPAPEITESGSLPQGVTFNSATTTLHGVPEAGTNGSYPITITAKNAAGTITQRFTLTVTTPPGPSFIHALLGNYLRG